jgi:hypothetical protein
MPFFVDGAERPGRTPGARPRRHRSGRPTPHRSFDRWPPPHPSRLPVVVRSRTDYVRLQSHPPTSPCRALRRTGASTDGEVRGQPIREAGGGSDGPFQVPRAGHDRRPGAAGLRLRDPVMAPTKDSWRRRPSWIGSSPVEPPTSDRGSTVPGSRSCASRAPGRLRGHTNRNVRRCSRLVRRGWRARRFEPRSAMMAA